MKKFILLVLLAVVALPAQCLAAMALCIETNNSKYCIILPIKSGDNTKITFTETSSTSNSVEFVGITDPYIPEIIDKTSHEIKPPADTLIIINRERIGINIGYPSNYFWKDFGAINYEKLIPVIKNFSLYPEKASTTLSTIVMSDIDINNVEDGVIIVDFYEGTTNYFLSDYNDIYTQRRQITENMYVEIRTYSKYKNHASNILKYISIAKYEN